MTPERKELTDEEIERLLDETCGPKPKPKPKLVAVDGHVVRGGEVQVPPADPNYRHSNRGFVRINMAEAEAQRAWAEQDRAHARARQREIDPFGYGHWGAWED